MIRFQLRVGDIVVDPDKRVWVVEEIHKDKIANVKCSNGGSYCFWTEQSLYSIMSVKDIKGE